MSVYTPLSAEREVETKPVTEQDVLDRAADLLEEFGWCQGSLALDEEGRGIWDQNDCWNSPRVARLCAMGAIFRAEHDLGMKFGDSCSFNGPEVVYWNNEPGRTKDAVVMALRAGLPQFRNV